MQRRSRCENNYHESQNEEKISDKYLYERVPRTTMVMRSIKTIEMKLKAEGDGQTIVEELRSDLGKRYSVFLDDDGRTVVIQGDLHDYRMRNRIIWKVSGGKHGFDVQASENRPN